MKYSSFLLIPALLIQSELQAQKTSTEPPPEMQRLLPPSAPYQLDAGAAQVLPLGQNGSVDTEVGVVVTSLDPMKKQALEFKWSVSKAPEGAQPVFRNPLAARTGLTLSKSGTYYLRVDVTAGDWKEWASVVVQVFSPQETGFAMNRFTPPPKPGVHPRIFFNPEDVPKLQSRLKNSVIGREMAKKLEVNSGLLRKGMAGFDPKGPLGKLIDGSPTVSNVGYFATGSDIYQKLVAGDLSALGPVIPAMGGPTANLSKQMAAEGLWCLLTGDEKGAKALAAAITTWARIVTPTIKPEDDWQWDNAKFKAGLLSYGKQEMGRIFDKVGRENIGLCYDFVYNAMTPEQRDVVRAMISKATSGKVGYATDQPHYARNGNWVTFHTASIMLLALAIEGEPGYDPSIYQRGAETFNDYYQYSVMEDGESFESLGKGGAYPLIVMAMARRGDWVAAHPHLRDYYRRYILNCFQPYGYHYIALSTLGDANLSGGMIVDACVAKYCYPNDPAVEQVYRNLLGENYGGAYNVSEFLPLTLWGHDFHTPAGQPLVWDKSQPLTYLGRDQGLVVTRSAWSSDALYLFFDGGSNIRDLGHYDPARNLFILSALGRNWIGDTGKEESAEAHSVVLIDGKGCSKAPGKLVSFKDSAEFTSFCGDAKFAYDWQWDRSGKTKGEIEPTTVNDLRFEPLPERWMQTPLTYLYSFFSPFRLARQPWNPVQQAYRTAALSRGPHPYVLLADAIQKDDQAHRYEFILRLADDLEDQVKVQQNDIVLSDPQTKRRLLIRFITPAGIEVTPRRVVIRKDLKVSKPTLSVAINAVRPDYRVLFYPYLEGDALPKTSWNETSHQLDVVFRDRTETWNINLPGNAAPSILKK